MEVGHKVYLKDQHSNKEPQEHDIVRVGRIYFYTTTGLTSREYKIEINTLRCVDCWRNKVYLSMQDYLDEQEYSSTLRHIERKIGRAYGNNITLDQLRQIKRIIDEPPKSEIKFPTE